MALRRGSVLASRDRVPASGFCAMWNGWAYARPPAPSACANGDGAVLLGMGQARHSVP